MLFLLFVFCCAFSAITTWHGADKFSCVQELSTMIKCDVLTLVPIDIIDNLASVFEKDTSFKFVNVGGKAFASPGDVFFFSFNDVNEMFPCMEYWIIKKNARNEIVKTKEPKIKAQEFRKLRAYLLQDEEDLL